MKKLTIIILFLTTVSVSCNKSGVGPASAANCDKETAVYTKAFDAWVADPTSKPKCEVFRKSLDDLVNKCTVLTPALRKQYQDDLKDFTCN
jgi:hypothetical protein